MEGEKLKSEETACSGEMRGLLLEHVGKSRKWMNSIPIDWSKKSEPSLSPRPCWASTTSTGIMRRERYQLGKTLCDGWHFHRKTGKRAHFFSSSYEYLDCRILGDMSLIWVRHLHLV
jgi:hypothetical protein